MNEEILTSTEVRISFYSFNLDTPQLKRIECYHIFFAVVGEFYCCGEVIVCVQEIYFVLIDCIADFLASDDLDFAIS